MVASKRVRWACVALTLGAFGTTGCQSWMQGATAIPSSSRVPPPGTGAYQVPNGYYNSVSSSAVVPTTSQVAANPANVSNQDTGLRATDLSNSTNFNPVQPANFQTTAMQPASTAQYQGTTSESGVWTNGQSVSFSDGSNVSAGPSPQYSEPAYADDPALQWQP